MRSGDELVSGSGKTFRFTRRIACRDIKQSFLPATAEQEKQVPPLVVIGPSMSNQSVLRFRACASASRDFTLKTLLMQASTASKNLNGTGGEVTTPTADGIDRLLVLSAWGRCCRVGRLWVCRRLRFCTSRFGDVCSTCCWQGERGHKTTASLPT